MVPVANGTIAIQVACLATLKKGSRVVMPDYTHIGSYVGVRDAGMTAIFSKTNEHTWTLDVEELKKHIDEFDAMLVVSPFGYLVNTSQYESLAKKYNKKIVYDFAGAWGQFPDTDFPVCYSLHATKGWSCGEGGLVSVASEKEAETIRKITTFNIGLDFTYGEDVGGNYKVDEIRCAIIAAQMNRYDRIISRMADRVITMKMYEDAFGCVPYTDSVTLATFPNMEKVNPSKLKEKFICKFYYPLLTEIPTLNHVYRFSKSSNYFNKCLALPIDVTREEQKIVISEIKNVLQR